MAEHEQSVVRENAFRSRPQIEPEEEIALRVREFDPVANANTCVTDTHAVEVHAARLRGSLKRQPAQARQSLLRLQRTRGNHYVQRVLALVRKSEGEAEVAPEVESAIERARGGGQALDSSVRMQMESVFGAEFSGVRIHTGTEAHSLNRAVNAIAFTTGQDIFFRDGAYSPESTSGKELLAHELTHVVQQNAAPAILARAHRVHVQRTCPACEEEQKAQAKLAVSQPQDADEVEADQTAKRVVGLLNSSSREAECAPAEDAQTRLHLAALSRSLQLGQQENNPAIELLDRSPSLTAAHREHSLLPVSKAPLAVRHDGCSCGGHCPKCAARQVQRQDAEEISDAGETLPGGLTSQRDEGTASQGQVSGREASAAQAADPAQCAECLAACAEGGERLAAFCRAIPDPRLRAACWALTFVGTVACQGWCYWHFCD